MIVMKFGGTSVGDGDRINRVLDIIAARSDEAPVVVSSAMGKTTDRLVAAAGSAVRGAMDECREHINALATAHQDALAILTDRLPDPRRREYGERLTALLSDLASLLEGIGLLKELSPRTSDAVLSFGERLATLLIMCGGENRGMFATLLDSTALVRTDSVFGQAQPDMAITTAQIRSAITPKKGHMWIVQGFLGANENGVTTTLGRGGSDYTATIFGKALNASRVEIWTDVNGIMTADPRVVPEARTIPDLTYGEAAELSFFGARVVHPATMVPAVEQGIPVHVCNTFDPEGAASRIGGAAGEPALRAIAGRRGVTIITVHSSRMLNAWGFLSRMFRVFEAHRVVVDLIATSEVSVSVSVDLQDPPGEMVNALAALGSVEIQKNRAVLSLVGEGIWRDTRLIRDVFDALSAEHSGVEMISLGSSDTNLSVVLAEEHLDAAIRRIHGRFFPSHSAAG